MDAEPGQILDDRLVQIELAFFAQLQETSARKDFVIEPIWNNSSASSRRRRPSRCSHRSQHAARPRDPRVRASSPGCSFAHELLDEAIDVGKRVPYLDEFAWPSLTQKPATVAAAPTIAASRTSRRVSCTSSPRGWRPRLRDAQLIENERVFLCRLAVALQAARLARRVRHPSRCETAADESSVLRARSRATHFAGS